VRYAARAYPGAIVLVEARDQPDRVAIERSWRSAAREVRYHVVPGTHTTMVTRHLDAVADALRPHVEALRSRREEAAAGPRADPRSGLRGRLPS